MESQNNLVLYSNDSLLVINKPAGLPTLPDGWDPSAPHLKSLLEPAYGPLWIVHRLDRETSGLIVLARSAEAHRDLNRQFDNRLVTKIYHALAIGTPSWEEQTARMPLRTGVGHKHRTIVDRRRGKPATTNFRVLERFNCAGQPFTLVEARPETGRTHQIRVHLAALGFPIASDPLYGGEVISLPQFQSEDAGLLRRVGLHACSLKLAHPMTGEPLLFKAPYPDDFSNTLRLLRKYC